MPLPRWSKKFVAYLEECSRQLDLALVLFLLAAIEGGSGCRQRCSTSQVLERPSIGHHLVTERDLRPSDHHQQRDAAKSQLAEWPKQQGQTNVTQYGSLLQDGPMQFLKVRLLKPPHSRVRAAAPHILRDS